MWSSWFAFLATEVSAIAANPAAQLRANGSDVLQTSATSRRSGAERRIGTASARTGNAGQVSA